MYQIVYSAPPDNNVGRDMSISKMIHLRNSSDSGQ